MSDGTIGRVMSAILMILKLRIQYKWSEVGSFLLCDRSNKTNKKLEGIEVNKIMMSGMVAATLNALSTFLKVTQRSEVGSLVAWVMSKDLVVERSL